MLKVAIVGCGRIADSHASQIQRIPGSQIVAVCDREPLMARQLYERYPIGKYFSDLSELLNSTKPDVVHITTSPESHFDIAKTCLEWGSHVYVEKPFTVNEAEARRLISLANEKGLKITAGHDDQFCHAARRMRSLVQTGYLGGGPLHMESYYGYEIAKSGYAAAILADKQHWVRRLPGQLLQNIISHGIARIAEFLTTESPTVIAHGFTSSALKDLGETEIIDKLRVIISEQEQVTAYFTFSSQMRPSLHQFRLYGAKNGLIMDQDHETLIRLRGSRFPSYLEKFAPSAIFAKQYLYNLSTNLGLFLARDFHFKSGMKFLIESFHRSIVADTPVPIPCREIILTAKIMDSIFAQIYSSQAQAPAQSPESVHASTSN
jgi:predicted dehydrogenase